MDTAGETARTEATRWLILLQEQPDDRALKAAFKSWLAASPVNAAAWAETSHVGALIAQTPPRYRAGWNHARRISWKRRAVSAAAALAAAAAIVLVLVPNVPLRFTADYATGTAELRAVSLPDGSVVHLAPDSAIDVDYAAGKRRIHLMAGSGFFEVKPDATRPFTVATDMIEATVLGTAFDVRLVEKGATVAVQHGAVQVENGVGLHERLGPGDWIRAGALRPVQRGTVPPDQAGAWVRGELIASDQPIAAIVAELRDYFHGAILIADDRLAEQRVTGFYDLNDPVQTLRAVAMTHGATLRQISPWVLVLSRD
jgi:transmembrane sensor